MNNHLICLKKSINIYLKAKNFLHTTQILDSNMYLLKDFSFFVIHGLYT